MNKIDGLHHLAISTADIKAQIAFFTDKLGMELVALYWMHGVKDAWHGFLRLNDESAIAFVQQPGNAKAEIRFGETHAGHAGAPSAPGTMQHVALRVRDPQELSAMQNRLRAKGVPVIGPIDHGFCRSIYFAGPENLALELSCSDAPIDAQSWIDPEVVALAGISADELRLYTRSSDFEDSHGPVAQPGPGAPGPHLANMPERAYARLLATPDEEILARSENEPPVKA